MRDETGVSAEEAANAERKANIEGNSDEPGLVDTLDKGYSSFVNPLVRPHESEEDLEDQREANDADARQPV